MINLGEVNLRKIKVADAFPKNEVVLFSQDHGVEKKDTQDLLKKKRAVIFSNPGVFVASYMASQIPTFESHFEKLKILGVEDVYCLVNNDYFTVANYAEKYQIKNIKFICDNDYLMTNALGYLADLRELNLGYRCWPIMLYIIDGIVHKIFYEDFAVTPIDCYSATSCLSLEKFLAERASSK